MVKWLKGLADREEVRGRESEEEASVLTLLFPSSPQ